MIPVDQTCPLCHCRFIGSDVVGGPCQACLGDEDIIAALDALNKIFNQEEEINDRPATN